MSVDSRKFLSVGVLLLTSTLAVHGATSKETTIVKDVSFSDSGDSLEAKIIAGEDSKYTYFELKDPHRLVMDFHGVQNSISFREKQIGAGGVDRVRTSFFSDKNRSATRIVFDLSGEVPYRVIEDGGGVVRIVFGHTVSAPLNQTAGPVMVPEPGSYTVLGSSSPALKLASLLPVLEPPVPLEAVPPIEVVPP